MEGLVSGAFAGRYAGRRVLVTGHTGFKGAWLSLWLHALGAKVHGYSNGATTNPNLHECVAPGTFAAETTADVRDASAMRDALASARPEIVFHLAAQSLVRRSYREPMETLSVNVLGTATVLEAIRETATPCAVVVVTSDKCYENRGWDYGYREDDALGGRDVYSMSKAATELVAAAWRQSFFAADGRLGPLATVRAGNVIGGGDYAEDRIVPDCVRALLAGRAIGVRHPEATRPWQHVLDCLSGYLWLGARLLEEGAGSPLADAFNFGPGLQADRPVAALVQAFLQQWPGAWRDESDRASHHEAMRLQLSTDKAAHRLRWFPTWEFGDAVRETARWYHARHVSSDVDMREFTLAQIAAFTGAAADGRREWAVPR